LLGAAGQCKHDRLIFFIVKGKTDKKVKKSGGTHKGEAVEKMDYQR
jgi:hypothetical protein